MENKKTTLNKWNKLVLLTFLLFFLPTTHSNAQCYDEWSCYMQEFGYWENQWANQNVLPEVIVTASYTGNDTSYYTDFDFGVLGNLGNVTNGNYDIQVTQPIVEEANAKKEKKPSLEELIDKAFNASKLKTVTLAIRGGNQGEVVDGNLVREGTILGSMVLETAEGSKFGIVSHTNKDGGRETSYSVQGNILGSKTNLTYNLDGTYQLETGGEKGFNSKIELNKSNGNFAFELGDKDGNKIGVAVKDGGVEGTVGVGIGGATVNSNGYNANLESQIFKDVPTSIVFKAFSNPNDLGGSINIDLNLY